VDPVFIVLAYILVVAIYIPMTVALALILRKQRKNLG